MPQKTRANNPSPYLVRLIGKNAGCLYDGFYGDKECSDLLGFGQSLAKAAHQAFKTKGIIPAPVGKKSGPKTTAQVN